MRMLVCSRRTTAVGACSRRPISASWSAAAGATTDSGGGSAKQIRFLQTI